MFLIKSTTTVPATLYPKWGGMVSNKSTVIVDYYRLGTPVYLTEATLYESEYDVRKQWCTLVEEWNSYHEQQFNIFKERGISEENLKHIKDRQNQTVFEVIIIDTIVAPDDFNTAFPFDKDHIPDEDRDVIFIDRLGKISGVVTNFLRKEMLAGHYLNKNPLMERWKYIPDSPYLTFKKKGIVT